MYSKIATSASLFEFLGNGYANSSAHNHFNLTLHLFSWQQLKINHALVLSHIALTMPSEAFSLETGPNML